MFWSLMWGILISETPASHPRIDPREREYIEKSQGLLGAIHVSHLTAEQQLFSVG